MVELVRDIRSTIGYQPGEFNTYAIDCGSKEFDALIKLNLIMIMFLIYLH